MDPADAVSRARVYFTPKGRSVWYHVPMKAAEAGVFAGILPRPKSGLDGFNYYVEALDRSFGASRTPEYAARVVSGPGVCVDEETAVALAAGSAVVGRPTEAVSPVPEGFSASGVVPVSAVSAETGSAPAAAAGSGAAAGPGILAGGGGIAGPLIGVAVAGAAAIGLAAIDPELGVSDGNDDSPEQCNTPGLRLTVNVGPGAQPAISWTPPCVVASILVETTDDGGSDLWSEGQGQLRPPVQYTGPSLTTGTRYNVILFEGGDNALGILTFTR